MNSKVSIDCAIVPAAGMPVADLEALTRWFCISACVLQVRNVAVKSPALNISQPHCLATSGLLSCVSCSTHSAVCGHQLSGHVA